jgi:hypothetical protein
MTKDKTKPIKDFIEDTTPDAAQELLDMAEKLIVARKLPVGITIQCPKCSHEIKLSAKPPKAKLVFTVPEKG